MAVQPVPRQDTLPDGLAGLVRADNQFGADLYRALSERTGNLAISPLSVSTALRALRQGARGETARQMARVLHADMGVSAAAQALGHRNRSLAEAAQAEKVRLDIANMLWLQSGLPVRDDFIGVLRDDFRASVHDADFRTEPEGARTRINDAVADATRGLIDDLFPRGTIDELTRVVIANAVYLKADWATPFPEHRTRDQAFHTPDGDVTTAMMHLDATLGYADGDDYRAVTLPYAGGRLAMTVLLPDGSLAGLEKQLAERGLGTLLAGAEPTEVSLVLPKFTVRTGAHLNDILRGLGMTLPFTERADFSGITSAYLKVSHVIHRAVVEVDEEGTEAAAATGVAAEVVSLRVDESATRVTVDHPFLFAITDTATGEPLFLGRVTDPTQQ